MLPWLLSPPRGLSNGTLWIAATQVHNLVVLLTLWPIFAVLFKRMHDLGKAGWIALVYFLPVAEGVYAVYQITTGDMSFDGLESIMANGLHVAVWCFIVGLGILLGVKGPNRYGPDPRHPEAAPDVF